MQLTKSWETDGHEPSLGSIRRAIADAVAPLAVPHLTANVQLAAAELLANALEASHGEPAVVQLDVTAQTVSITVTNPKHEPIGVPDPVAMPPASADRGRGLALVASVATRVMIDSSASKTTVRAEFTGVTSAAGRRD